MFEKTAGPSRLEEALAAVCPVWVAPLFSSDIFYPEHWARLGGLEWSPSAPDHPGLVSRSQPSDTRSDGSSAADVGAGPDPCLGVGPASEPAGAGSTSEPVGVDPAVEPSPLADPEFERRAAEFQADLASDAALLDTARAAEADIARAQAVRARALSAFAARRPNSLDRSDEEVGAAARASRALRPEALRAVSEFCVDEVAVGLSMNTHATTALMVDSVRLVDRLPGVLAALEAGTISWAHVVIACELIAPLSADLRARAEEHLVPRAVGRSPQSWRPMVRRLVMKLDADAIAARVAEAVRHRKVVVYPAADGMATLSAILPAPVARAVEDVLRRHAAAVRTPGDERSQGERMADCLVDLLLDPRGHGLSAVQAQLTVVASVGTLLGGSTEGDEPGEVGGDVVPAAMVRELAAALGLLPADTTASPADTPPELAAPDRAAAPDTDPDLELGDAPGSGADPTAPEGTCPRETGSATSDASGDHDRDRRTALAALLAVRNTAGTGLAARPTIALVDDRTGELVAITDTTGVRRAARDGTSLGPPPDVPGYEPSAALAAFVRLRDRRCQFPGCRARPVVCDLDHQHPWLACGKTAHDNLACLCTHHHRLSHQAPGWNLRRTDDGAGLHWTTPTRQTVVTRPPTAGRDDDRRPGPPTARVDEPPPF